jgi:hypothetical protein
MAKVSPNTTLGLCSFLLENGEFLSEAGNE